VNMFLLLWQETMECRVPLENLSLYMECLDRLLVVTMIHYKEELEADRKTKVSGIQKDLGS
jgi:hypothetical protein